LGTRFIRFSTYLTRRAYPAAGKKRGAASRVWIDVGAHRGETTFEKARKNPDIVVYAFEPDVSVASHRFALLDNFRVIAMAASIVDGLGEFHINSDDRTSSLLQLDQESVQTWYGAPGKLKSAQAVTVPTIRLDTFLKIAGIQKVEYLKIDAQGHDFEVLQSLGVRIKDVDTIQVEALVAARSMYIDAHNQVAEVKSFMENQGFGLTENSDETFGREANLVFRRKAVQELAQSARVSVDTF